MPMQVLPTEQYFEMVKELLAAEGSAFVRVTGKTTLGKLLEKHCQSVIINGDFALLSVSDEHGAVFEPTPICGTSGTCHNYRLPISHIVFLEQAKETTIRPLPARQALVRLVSNAFVPQWDAEIRSSLEAFALQLLAKTPVSVMAFPPTQEAAQALADYLQS